MVNNKIAQRAVAAGLSGLMAFGAAAPAALAFTWTKDVVFRNVSSNDDGKYWKRLAGDTRYDTMKKIVDSYNEFYATTGDINRILWGTGSREVYNYHATAVVASGDNFPDALAANGLAGYLSNVGLTNGAVGNTNNSVPLILTKSNTLSSQAKDLLKGMQVQNVILMGGTAAISQDVENAINKMGIGTSRVAGKDRQETSLKALQRINGNWNGRKGTYDLIIATGSNYADALSISPYAYRMGTPVLLTKDDGTLTDEQVKAIKDNDEIKEIVIVGGTSAVSDQVMGQIGTLKNNKYGVHYTRLAGADRYETSAKIAEFEVASWTDYILTNINRMTWRGNYQDYAGSMWEIMGYSNGFDFDHCMVATGENFPDALAGGQLAGGVWSNYEGVSVKDFDDSYGNWNAWNPSPLLLVKDGNLMADSLIAAQLGTNREFGVNDVLYTTEVGWNNVLENTYMKSDPTYTKYWNDWYGTMRGTDYMYVTQKQLDSWFGATNLQGVPLSTAGYTENVKVEYEFDDNGNLFSCKLNGQFVNANFVQGVANDPTQPDRLVLSNAPIVLSDGGRIESPVDIYTWPGGTDHTTGTAKKNTVTYGVRVFNNTSAKAQIVGFSGRRQDFYGIILGGTAAVSNKKRDELDDVVARVARPDNFKLTDTLTLTKNTFLNTGVILNEPYVRMFYYGTYTGTVNNQQNVTVDLYKVAGSAHMLGRAGNTWYFFQDGLANKEVDALR